MKTAQLTPTITSTRVSTLLPVTAANRLARPMPNPALGRHPANSKTTCKMKKRIRVLLADDHPVVRQGIAFCLGRHPGIEVIGEAADGREALGKIRELLPDMVLMDIDMPHMSGLAVAEVLRRELPQIKVLILSMHQQSEYVLRILQSGAHGYVLKESPTDELIKAIETVHTGEAFFSPEIARVALNQFVHGHGNGHGPDPSRLTPREREVLIHIAEGCSNKEIACQLNVGVRTIETHRERIMRKLDIHSIAGLTRFAIAKGLVTLREDVRR
jgi:two-component system, NarL family, nitrate/nitrite response regulator NarL